TGLAAAGGSWPPAAPPAPCGLRPTCSSDDPHVHLHVGGRDRDRAVQGSTSLEAFDDGGGLLLTRSRHVDVDAYGVEKGHVLARLIRAIEHRMELYRHLLQRHALFFRDDLQQLHPAGCHARKEHLWRGQLLPGTPV